MNLLKSSNTLTTGLAMFAMFFGAGNTIFPLMVGYQSLDTPLYAICGLLLTAVVIPFAGLIGMILFNGDYMRFFGRMGEIPGFLVAFLIMVLLGPLGATPRCIVTSFTTLNLSFSGINPLIFNGCSCLLIFLFCFRKNQVLKLIGAFLTPVLLAFLGFIIIKGFFSAEPPVVELQNQWDQFLNGFIEGYNTMDLLAAFFFAPSILAALRTKRGEDALTKDVFKSALKASCIGALLLSVTYIGFCYIAFYHGNQIEMTSPEELIGLVSHAIIGPWAGLVVSAIIALACFTTAIAITSVFSDFLQNIIFRDRVSYLCCLVISLVMTYGISILQFSGIAAIIVPLLQLSYPALIVLTLVNIFYQLEGFRFIKAPVFITFGLCCVYYFFHFLT